MAFRGSKASRAQGFEVKALTPTLSQRAREKRVPLPAGESNPRSPLPPGEGQGEGIKWHLLHLVVLCLLAGALPSPARADISVRASLNPQRAQVGEPLTLAIDVSGAQNVAAPAVNADGFDVQYVGPSTQISIVNANISRSVQHRYSLLPLRAGHFTVGPFTVEYEGKTYKTASFSVDVVAAAQVPQAQAPQGHGAACSTGDRPSWRNSVRHCGGACVATDGLGTAAGGLSA